MSKKTGRPRSRTNMLRNESGELICPVDGQLLSTHLRCFGCGILIGQGHLESGERKVNEKPYCLSCFRRM